MKTFEERMDDARRDLADMVCGNCQEYKGMTENADGERYCMFCE